MLGHCPQSMHHRSCTIDRLRAQSCAYGHANGSCLLGQLTADRSFFRNLYYSWRIFVHVYRTQAPTSYNKKVFFFFFGETSAVSKTWFLFLSKCIHTWYTVRRTLLLLNCCCERTACSLPTAVYWTYLYPRYSPINIYMQ